MFALTNDEDGYNKERKQKLMDLSDPECYNWENLIVSYIILNIPMSLLSIYLLMYIIISTLLEQR